MDGPTNLFKIRLITLLILFSIISQGFSQPGWVKDIIKQAADIKISKDASAIILSRIQEVEISSNIESYSKIKIVTKILSQNGIQYAVLTEPIYQFREVKNLKGWLINSEGDCHSLKKDNIIEASEMITTQGYYDDMRLMIASFPDVEPGSIVAYEYTVHEKEWTSLYQEFIFQEQQPVKYSKLIVKIPDKWKLNNVGWRAESITFTQDENIYEWSTKNLPYQPEEPLSPSWYYLSRRVAFNCYDPENRVHPNFDNWISVAKWFSQVNSFIEAPVDNISSKVAEITHGLDTYEDKINAIANFCRDEIRYVGVEIGKGRWRPRLPTKTLFNRYGDCKDKAALMCAMLQAAEIPSVPVLTNIYYPVKKQLPTPFQFNHCIIAIPIESKKLSPKLQDAVVNNWLFYDPTDPETRIGELPESLQGDYVLLASDQDSLLFQIPYPSPEDFRRDYKANAKLRKDGSFSAYVMINDFGGYTTKTRHWYKTTPLKEQIEFWQEYMTNLIPNLELKNYAIQDRGDSISISFELRCNKYIQKTGNFILLNPNLFYKYEPPELTAETRENPIWFGAPKKITTLVNWELPTNWIVDADTNQFSSECIAASIASKIMVIDSALSITTTYQDNGNLMRPEEYEIAKIFSSDVSRVKGTTILLKNN